jgi:ABC-2 type transport system ATP-binding protein
MFRGDIQQMGTPAELRASLGATRLEVRARAALGVAEQTLSAASDPDGDIIDVQRYGDRLDVLVRHPERTEADVRRRLTEVGLEVEEIRRDEPMLENTFVARLHALGEVVRHPEFPGQHDHRELRGQTAIGASRLVKDFGAFRAVNQVSLQVEYGEVYGLLGANGAGKTTTIKMLCGLLDQTSGSVALAGVDRHIRTSAVRQRVGYMSQKFSLYDDLPVDETSSSSPGSTECLKTSAPTRSPGYSRSPVSNNKRISWWAACRAAGSSAWRSVRPSCTSRRCSSSTSRRRASTPWPAGRFGASSTGSPMPAPPFS